MIGVVNHSTKLSTAYSGSNRAGKRLQNAQKRSSLNFKGVADADYYEVYEKDGDNWRLLGSSAQPSIFKD